eukprot:CAMPEP_0202439420 /NCGR_PEP_ID=MMETSP1345-20130828/36148_1 /ASSEMBLY_ACC=CAM_ASM_000843 /TAXON_ID=342563 /ORGANISM="Fabrea Fabrea salina" /LENGTH=790 /DNA_ID=CAMNT_0049053953 /DNA_START=63 /DNA_END=2436 /DNA_ORIENTATION=+
MTLGWEFSNTTETVDFTFKCTAGWCGIGFGKDMKDVDMIVAIRREDTIDLMDLWSISDSTPPPDTSFGGTYDLELVSQKILSGGFEVTFRRALDTGDEYDHPLSVDLEMEINWAWLGAAKWVEHSKDANAKIKFSATQEGLIFQPSESDDLRNHGVLMSVIWAGLAPLMIMTARYFKWWWPWYWIHLILGGTVTVLSILSASAIFSEEKNSFSVMDEDEKIHSRIGLTLVGLVCSEAVLGLTTRWFANYFKLYSRIMVVRRIHQVLGWSLLVAGLYNIANGWHIFDEDELAIYFPCVVLVILVFVLLEIRHRLSYKYKWLSIGKKNLPEMTHAEVLMQVEKNSKQYVFFERLVPNGWHIFDEDELAIYLPFLALIIVVFVLLEIRHQLAHKYPWLSFSKKNLPEMTHAEVLMQVEKNSKQYVFFERLVLDIKKFQFSHPGGKFLLEDTMGEDMGKYMVGISSSGGLMPLNILRKPSKCFKGGEDMGKYMVGISSSGGLMPYEHSKEAFEMLQRLAIAIVKETYGFFKSKTGQEKPIQTFIHITQELKFKLHSKEQLCKNTFLVNLESEDYQLANGILDLSWIGKHFKLTHSIQGRTVARYYSSIFSDLEAWKRDLGLSGVSYAREPGQVSLIYKAYPRGAMTQHLNSLEKGQSVQVEGPLGPGLCITSLEGHFLGVAGGTGLIPFLDLVSYMYFHRDTLQGFSLDLYASFASREEAFGVELLEATSRVMERFRVEVVYSNETGRSEAEKKVEQLGRKEVKRCWVCGPSGFNSFVFKTLTPLLPRNKIIVL